jgi:hypothetical protein
MSKPKQREREEGAVETPAEREQRNNDPYEILSEVATMLEERHPVLEYEAIGDYVFKATLLYIPDNTPECKVTLQAERTASCLKPVVRMSMGDSDTFLTIEASDDVNRAMHVFNVTMSFVHAPKEKRQALLAVQKFSDEHLLGLRWILGDQLTLKQNKLEIFYDFFETGTYGVVEHSDPNWNQLTVGQVNAKALVTWELNPNAIDSNAYHRERELRKRKLDDASETKEPREPKASVPAVRFAWNLFMDKLSSAVERSYAFLRECAAICESNLSFSDVGFSMVELALVFRHEATDMTLMVPMNGTIILQSSTDAKEFTIHDSPAKVMITFLRAVCIILRKRREMDAGSETSKKTMP